MKRGSTFAAVRELAVALPGVAEGTAWGLPALRLRGKFLACMASHKSAEPNTLVVRIDFFERDLRIGNEPDIYYLKPHYVNYPCVLTRLSRIDDTALSELLESGWRFIKKKKAARTGRSRS